MLGKSLHTPAHPREGNQTNILLDTRLRGWERNGRGNAVEIYKRLPACAGMSGESAATDREV